MSGDGSPTHRHGPSVRLGLSRLKKIDKADTANATETWYFGPVEIRGPGPANEVAMTNPQDDVRTRNGVASLLYRDHLGSIERIADTSGGEDYERIYQPFGSMEEFVRDATAPEGYKGWIGGYFDQDTGLQYLNARHCDPDFSMFLPPDWRDVREPGVGPSRYVHAFDIR